MGAILSLPLQMAGSVAASFAGTSASQLVSSAVKSVFGGRAGGTSTRIAYAALFLVTSLMSWLARSAFLSTWLERLPFTCGGQECTAFVAVQRIQGTLALLHLVLAATLSFRPYRRLQNGFWAAKLCFFFILLFVSFFAVPASFWLWWGSHLAPLLSFIFVFIGLVLLVDAAHEWAETCISHIEMGEREHLWTRLLVSSTLLLYLTAAGLTALMATRFAGEQCVLNRVAIVVNALLAVSTSCLSLSQIVREHNPSAGLAQSAIVAAYCTYLTLSALLSEPNNTNCNPWDVSSKTRGATAALGAAFTLGAIAYTTSRAAASSSASEGELALSSDERRQALHDAVRLGSLPESALNDEEWLAGEPDGEDADGYNYVIFHLVFLLATQYTASLLTINVESDLQGGFVAVGRSYFAARMKIGSAWCCYVLYGWTLLAPVLFPDRFDQF